MATRISSCVALVIPFIASGCFFFGGGDKKPKASGVSAQTPGVAPVLVPQGSPPVAPPQQPRTSQARKSATPPTIIPQESVVDWPNPDDLNLGGVAKDEPAEPQPREVARNSRESARAPIAVEGSLEDQEDAVGTAEAVEPAEHGSDVVANHPLEVGVAPAQTAADVTPAANHVAAAASAKSTDGGEVSARIARSLRESPGDLVANLDYQIMRFLADEPAPDLDSIAGLPAEDRELIVALVDGLTNFRNGLKSEQNPLLAQKIRPLLDLTSRLRSQAELTIPTIALSEKVRGFGMYEPIEGKFIGGRTNETIVYCEVGNVSSQQNEQGVWESRLTQEAVLFKEDGQRVWSNPRHAVNDKTRNRRQDFFVAQRLELPANLATDRYILKVTVMDEQVKRLAEATMPIEIVANMPQRQQPAPGAADKPPVVRAPQPASAPLPAVSGARTASERQPAPRARESRESATLDQR